MSKSQPTRRRRNHAEELADTMLSQLQVQKSGIEYPMTLGRLGKTACQQASEDMIRRATRTKAFRSIAMVAIGDQVSAPVAFLDDLEALAASPLTIYATFDKLSNRKTKAFSLPTLRETLTGRQNKALRRRFQEIIVDQMQHATLPREIGFIAGPKGRSLLFQVTNLQPAAWRKALQSDFALSAEGCAATAVHESSQGEHRPVNRCTTSSFTDVFESAFQRLDSQQGGHNFVTLESLRKELPDYSRSEFDQKLRELRLARRFRLSGAENRDDVSPAQLDAGIREAGSLLLYAQRIKP